MAQMDMQDGNRDQKVALIEDRSRVIVWSSIVFALLQSLCTALVALSGVRTLIGAGAMALSSTSLLVRFHQPAIRLPMLALSCLGAVVDLVVLWQIRRLRERSASQWRQKPVSVTRKRAERAQLILSVCTLLLVAAELTSHKHLHGVFFARNGGSSHVVCASVSAARISKRATNGVWNVAARTDS